MAASRKLFFLKRADKLLSQGKLGPAIEELKKILEFDKDINIILKLGKIYLQRGRYDQTYKLFLPIINENIEDKKFDEAANLLRFIIAYNKSYLPALTKLAEIFKLSGKTNNLIALYESLVSIYEEKGMKQELKSISEELSQLSHTPLNDEEQLAKRTGQQEKNEEKAESDTNFDTIELDLDISDMQEKGDSDFEEDDVLVLSEVENLTTIPIDEVKGEDSSKSLSSVISELDFYINDGYFGDAEKLIGQLKQEYPGNKQLLARIDRLKKTKMEDQPDHEKHQKPVIEEIVEPDGSTSRGIKRSVEEKSTTDSDISYKEIYNLDLEFDSEEDLLQGEAPFLDDDEYLEIEKNVDNELKSIKKFNQWKPSLTLPLEQHGKDKHQVMCTVFSPPLVKIGSEILVQVFAHLYENSQEAQQMATEFDEDTKSRGAKTLQTAIQKGTELMFELKMKDAVIAESIRTMIWNGYTESVSFDVKIPENFTKNNLIGKVVISQNTVPIGMINFRIKIQKIEDKIPIKPLPLPIGEAKTYKYAFISYASEDREEVLRRVQMLSLLKIDYFQDIFSLDPGDRWERKLYQKIDEADVFFLFWSNAARNSQWVIKEISYAIQRKQGIDENPPEIIPVIIEGPPVPEPPSELKHIHFNDKVIYFIR